MVRLLPVPWGFLTNYELLLFLASLNPRAMNIAAGIPKNIIPILAARGSASITELTDHAIANNSKKIPKQPNNQAGQVILYVLFSFKIPNTNSVARIPNMKNNVIIVLNFKID